MKAVLLILGLLFLSNSLCYAGDVSVKGYYRKDGTYVRPHHRSSPDSDLSNNYGKASYQQRKEYQNLPVIPSYKNDYDNDGTPNRYDKDDDNDGVSDNYDAGQYSRRQNSQKTYQPSYTLPNYDYKTQYKPSYSNNNEDEEDNLEDDNEDE